LGDVNVRVNGVGADLSGHFGRLGWACSDNGYVNFVGFGLVIVVGPLSFFLSALLGCVLMRCAAGTLRGLCLLIVRRLGRFFWKSLRWAGCCVCWFCGDRSMVNTYAAAIVNTIGVVALFLSELGSDFSGQSGVLLAFQFCRVH